MPLNNKHPVFNFALTWESIYLNLDLDGAAARRCPHRAWRAI